MRTPYNWANLAGEPDHCAHCGHWLYPCTNSEGHCIERGCFYYHAPTDDCKLGEGHDLLVKAQEFAAAASALSEEWDVDDNADIMHSGAPNAAYPFKMSFDDLSAEIWVWRDAIRDAVMWRAKHPVVPVPVTKALSCFYCFGDSVTDSSPFAHIVEAMSCGCWKEWHKGLVVAWFNCRSQVEDALGHKKCDSASRITPILYS